MRLYYYQFVEYRVDGVDSTANYQSQPEFVETIVIGAVTPRSGQCSITFGTNLGGNYPIGGYAYEDVPGLHIEGGGSLFGGPIGEYLYWDVLNLQSTAMDLSVNFEGKTYRLKLM